MDWSKYSLKNIEKDTNACMYEGNFLHLQNKSIQYETQSLEKTMINRELIRIKIVQLTYAYHQNGNRNMDNAEKELLSAWRKRMTSIITSWP